MTDTEGTKDAGPPAPFYDFVMTTLMTRMRDANSKGYAREARTLHRIFIDIAEHARKIGIREAPHVNRYGDRHE